jgi:hypothetical protein
MATAVGTMTDLPQTTPRPPDRPVQTSSKIDEPPRGATAPSRARNAHPMLSPFPLTVMTLTIFLVLFALMMARLKASADPALRASTTTPVAAASSGGRAVITHASGGGESAAKLAPAAGSEESSASPSVITRRSGAPGTTEARDE